MQVGSLNLSIYTLLYHSKYLNNSELSRIITMIEILTQVRWYRLTSNEIAAGLKPLVIKIHPDLYANYPDIQEVNSRSLSSLQSWLDQLNDQTPNLQKLPVSFYLKRKDNKPRSVSVLLEPTEIREALRLGMIIS